MKGCNEVFINSCLICVLRWHRSPQRDVFLWKYEAYITGEGPYYFRGFRCTLFKQAVLVKVYHVILDGDIDVLRLIHCCFVEGQELFLTLFFVFCYFTPFEEHLVFTVLYGRTLEIYCKDMKCWEGHMNINNAKIEQSALIFCHAVMQLISKSRLYQPLDELKCVLIITWAALSISTCS